MVHPPQSDSELQLDSLLPESVIDLDSSLVDLTVESKELAIPEEIGRYRVDSLLGEGGFGQVFKALDGQLERWVAIKVPHLHRITSSQALDKYLDEARTLAKLEHPAIVQVHDVGKTENGLPYIVSNYVNGRSLAVTLSERELTLREAIEVLVTIGKALAYMHSKGVVHRDVKPANILLTKDDRPFLADFGLAIRDEYIERENRRAGTPAYMSPEQARGEAHLIDGRSDVFSLGVILFLMLTGKLPFEGKDRAEGVRKLLERNVTPPRQLNSAVPRELDRICLKALAKRPSDRYSSAGDLVDDLSLYLEQEHESGSKDPLPSAASTGTTRSLSSQTRVDVVPRGLRSYERHDADFFSQLLPGPYSRDWVPESLLFWKRRLLNTEANYENLRIGVLYGPSGCGKSSFVKAGLLPNLHDKVQTVFVEATHDDTEVRLLRGIRKKYPTLSVDASLSESIAEIRREGDRSGKKLLIVIDQFEQWLNGRDGQETSELALALRQCDGISVHCLILIRDDFWLAMSRFASILEVPLRQNQNVMLVDLFTKSHARHVLAMFGAAYGCLPDKNGVTQEQSDFLDLAVDQLSDEGRIIPIRLSLFCEMVKSQPWEVATLDRVGGIKGIGTKFLEDSFSSSLAPASHRVHEAAARNVLRLLLPDQGGALKGNMQPEDRLRTAANYDSQPTAFEDLVDILDGELRLITPTDPAGSLSSEESQSASGDGLRYYQLTHDFLVPELYAWLNKKQRETRRGRAELQLSEYASLWSSKPAAKFTPAWHEWLNIRCLTSAQSWNASETKMMRAAGKRHFRNLLFLLVAVAALIGTGIWWRDRARAHRIVDQLRIAKMDQIVPLVGQLSSSPRVAKDVLSRAIEEEEDEQVEMRLRLGLLQHDPQQRAWLEEEVRTSPVPLISVIGDQLRGAQDNAQPSPLFAELVENEKADPKERFRSAVVLAGYCQEDDPEGQAGIRELLDRNSEWLVSAMLGHLESAPQDFLAVREAFEPVKSSLYERLRTLTLDPYPGTRRSSATALLASYARDDAARLLDIMLEVSPQQYDVFMPELEPKLAELKGELTQVAYEKIDPTLGEEQYDRQAMRQATAAALLQRLGNDAAVWPLLKVSPMPHARTYLIDRLNQFGEDSETVLLRLSREIDNGARQALVIALGYYDWNRQDPALKTQAIALAKQAFSDDPSVQVHSAARWFLRRIGESEWVDEELARLSQLEPHPRKNWYVNTEGHTMAIIDGRDIPNIGYVYEIATMEVSVEQYLRFQPDHSYYEYRSPTEDCPVGLCNWFDATEYCRWLSERLTPEAVRYPEFDPDVQISEGRHKYPEVVSGGAYRLPTRAEWLFACQTITKSSRYFGDCESLVNTWLWTYDAVVDFETAKVRYWPGDTKPPNQSGLFALYDGVREWGHDLVPPDRRSMLGHASSVDPQVMITAEMMASDLPAGRNGYYGMRIARTVVE